MHLTSSPSSAPDPVSNAATSSNGSRPLVSRLVTSGLLVEVLRANEDRYLDVTVALILDIAAMDRFRNLERQVDGAEMVAAASTDPSLSSSSSRPFPGPTCPARRSSRGQSTMGTGESEILFHHQLGFRQCDLQGFPPSHPGGGLRQRAALSLLPTTPGSR